MSYVFTSLNNASSNGAGTAVDLLGYTREATIQAVVSGSASQGQVYLQGSLDGISWYIVATVNVTGVGVFAASTYVNCSNATPGFRFVRAYLAGGGTTTAVIYVSDIS